MWIDDDYDLIGALMVRLHQADYHIVKLRTYSEALEEIQLIKNCDILILDILLPQGSKEAIEIDGSNFYTGLILLRLLQDDHNFDRPVIVCSVVTQNEIIQELETRADTVLYKPEMTATKMKQEVEQVLN